MVADNGEKCDYISLIMRRLSSHNKRYIAIIFCLPICKKLSTDHYPANMLTRHLVKVILASFLLSSFQVSSASEVEPYAPSFLALTGGSRHACAITDERKIYCWGQNSFSQLGTSEYKDNLNPHFVYQINDASKVVAGDLHTCAIVSNGNVKCWGNNNKGQVGDGRKDLGTRHLPVYVHSISSAKSLALGKDHSCALLTDGSVKCWGSNSFGQLGNGNQTDSLLPVNVALEQKVIEIVSGYNHACALVSIGDIYCWGDNTNGQLGIGNKVSRSTPTLVLGISNSKNLTANFNSTCAVDVNQNGNCWGEGTDGQLGNNDSVDKTLPTKVIDKWQTNKTVGTYGPAANVVSVQVGKSISCLLSTLETLHCWNSTTGGTGVSSPYYVGQTQTSGNALSVQEYSVGSDYYCVLRKDNSIYCSGKNDEGQFGIGSTQSSTISSLVPLNYWPAAPDNIKIAISGNIIVVNWTRDVTDYDPAPIAKNLSTTVKVELNHGEFVCEAISNPTCSLGPIKNNTTYTLTLIANNTKKVSKRSLTITTKDVLSDQELRDKLAREEAEVNLKKEEEAKKLSAAAEELKKKEALEAAAAEENFRLEQIRKAAELAKEKELQKIKDVCFDYAMKLEELRFAIENLISKFASTKFEPSFKKLLSMLPETRYCAQVNYEINDFDEPIRNLEVLTLAKLELNSDAERLLRGGKLLYAFTCTKGNLRKQLIKNKIACPPGYKLRERKL